MAHKQIESNNDYVDSNVDTHANYDSNASDYANVIYSHDWNHIDCYPNDYNNNYKSNLESLSQYEMYGDMNNVDGYEYVHSEGAETPHPLYTYEDDCTDSDHVIQYYDVVQVYEMDEIQEQVTPEVNEVTYCDQQMDMACTTEKDFQDCPNPLYDNTIEVNKFIFFNGVFENDSHVISNPLYEEENSF